MLFTAVPVQSELFISCSYYDSHYYYCFPQLTQWGANTKAQYLGCTLAE